MSRCGRDAYGQFTNLRFTSCWLQLPEAWQTVLHAFSRVPCVVAARILFASFQKRASLWREAAESFIPVTISSTCPVSHCTWASLASKGRSNDSNGIPTTRCRERLDGDICPSHRFITCILQLLSADTGARPNRLKSYRIPRSHLQHPQH